MEQVRVLRIVVASPGDVQAERKALPDVIDEINRGVAADRNLRLELSRWETDTYPGFHADGPQGEIDKILRIDDCDLLIGIFWHRFGTPTMDAASGTEHEFRLAYQTWQRSRRPQIMVYFNANAYSPRSREETDQWGRVLEFQRNFPKEGLWWPYRGSKHLASLVRNHLTHYVRTLHDVRPLHAPWIAVDDENTSQGVLETADDGATKDLDEIRKILNEQARIEVVRYITKGEISNVYLGRYGTRLMAIKEIDAAELSSSDRTKLKKEIELGSLLRDPAFLRLCQVIFHSGRCFIVTDFFEGETIAHKIQQGPVFSTGDVIEILYQLSGGIAEAHARGMQYLRITPSDIFVHSDKILDRQIVRLSPINFKYFIENLRSKYEFRWRDGSLFNAPELWREPSDLDDDTGSMHQKANQFALGMLAWMMLEGRMPIAIDQRGTAFEKVTAYLEASKSFSQSVLDSKWRGQARALADIVARMVSADPKLRWKDMKQVNLLIGGLTENLECNLQDIVKNVYQSVCEGKPAFYARFYKNFFRRAPQLEKMFPSDMNRQYQMLHLALGQLLNYVPGQLEPTTLSQFVDRHSRLRLVAEDYTQFGEALIQTFDFELRESAERDSTITALKIIIWHGINYLIQKCTSRPTLAQPNFLR